MRHCLTSGILRDLLRGVSRAFARTLETDAACARPADEISLHVGNRDLRVVESGENICNAHRDIFRVLGFDNLLGIRVFAQKFGGSRRGDNWGFRERRSFNWRNSGFFTRLFFG